MDKNLFLSSYSSLQLVNSPWDLNLSYPEEDAPIWHYADALLMGNGTETFIANRFLQAWLGETDAVVREQLNYDETLLQLSSCDLQKFEEHAKAALGSISKHPLSCLYKERMKLLLSDDDLQKLERSARTNQRKLFYEQRIRLHRFRLLDQAKDHPFAPLLNRDKKFSFPYLPFRVESDKQTQWQESGSAIVWAEPYMEGWEALLTEAGERELLFLFFDEKMLWQCLGSELLFQRLLQPNSHILLLNYLPETLPGTNHYFALRSTRKNIDLYLDSLLDAEYHLPQLGNRLHDIDLAQRYGRSRHLALKNLIDTRDWHRRYPPLKKALPPLVDLEAPLLDRTERIGARRPIVKERKLRIAHVVPQVIAGGHAPTRLLSTLVDRTDREKYDLTIISSERLLFRPMEYPFNVYSSPPSDTRAGDLLRQWSDRGVSVFLEDAKLNYQQTAERITSHLSTLAIDIAVLHGPDPIHNLIAKASDVPLKVLFEHGTLPQKGGYDLMLTSSQDSLDCYGDRLRELGISTAILPFVVDCTSGWEKDPFPLSDYGVGDEAQILTTISNHLENRVCGAMLSAIDTILRDNPRAYYMPMGPMNHEDEFISRFAEDVRGRVRPLGSCANPSQIARSMTLYLNEFPFGSGLAILDAMAASCPIITMYDPDGPPQARYGATYYGRERSITTQNPQDYISLANQLLQDEKMYKQWAQAARVLYEERTDTKEYVASFESAISESLQRCAVVK